MSKIYFTISLQNQSNLETLFNELKVEKERGLILEDKIKEILKDKYHTKFIHTGSAELEQWKEKWEKLPHEERLTLKVPWHYESWISALNNAEIELISLQFNTGVSGILEFNELSFPSGGVEATEYIVKIYDATIQNNDAYPHTTEALR